MSGKRKPVKSFRQAQLTAVDKWIQSALDFLDAEDFESAEAAARRAIGYAVRRSEEHIVAMQLLASATSNLGKPEAARDLISEVLEMAPLNGSAYYDRAVYHANIERFGQASRDAERALALDQRVELVQEVQKFIARNQPHVDAECVLRSEEFTLANLIAQEDMYDKALAASKAKRFSEAEDLWCSAIEMGDARAVPWCNLAVALALQKRPKEAEMALERATELEPDHRAVKHNSDCLARLLELSHLEVLTDEVVMFMNEFI